MGTNYNSINSKDYLWHYKNYKYTKCAYHRVQGLSQDSLPLAWKNSDEINNCSTKENIIVPYAKNCVLSYKSIKNGEILVLYWVFRWCVSKIGLARYIAKILNKGLIFQHFWCFYKKVHNFWYTYVFLSTTIIYSTRNFSGKWQRILTQTSNSVLHNHEGVLDWNHLYTYTLWQARLWHAEFLVIYTSQT